MMEAWAIERETDDSGSHKITVRSQTNKDTCCVSLGKILQFSSSEVYICAKGFQIAQIGTSTELNEKTRSSEIESSHQNQRSDLEPVLTDSVDLWHHGHSKMMLFEVPRSMPVISKRGCLATRHHKLLLDKLADLQDIGDFQRHEQLVQIFQGSHSRRDDLDVVVSLNIERAKTLYYQNNLKTSKKTLKLVLKQATELKNPGVLLGRASVLLTAVYKREKKFGKAMRFVENASTRLQSEYSPNDIAELYYSYGALISAMPRAKELNTNRTIQQEACTAYEMACNRTEDTRFREYVHTKVAGILLKSDFDAEGMRLHQATKHLDSVEFGDKSREMALGTRIKLLALRSDQLCHEGLFAMARDRALQAYKLVKKHEFNLELAAAAERVDRLSALMARGAAIPSSNEEHSADSDVHIQEFSSGEETVS